MSQHMNALTRANEIRFARSDLKKLFRAKKITILQVLEEIPLYLQSETLYNLLQYQVRYGPARAGKVCDLMECSRTRRVGDLSPRQLGRLRDHFRNR